MWYVFLAWCRTLAHFPATTSQNISDHLKLTGLIYLLKMPGYLLWTATKHYPLQHLGGMCPLFVQDIIL